MASTRTTAPPGGGLGSSTCRTCAARPNSSNTTARTGPTAFSSHPARSACQRPRARQPRDLPAPPERTRRRHPAPCRPPQLRNSRNTGRIWRYAHACDDQPPTPRTPPPRPPARRRGLAQWSPLLLTVVLGALALATPEDFAVSRLLPAAPALAASMWSVAATVGLGAVTLAVVIAVQLAFDEPATAFTGAAVAAVTAAAAYAAHVRLQRERTLLQVRSVADTAQAVVLGRCRNGWGTWASRRCTWRRPKRPGSAATSSRRWTPRTGYGCSSATCAARGCPRSAWRAPSPTAFAKRPTTNPTWHMLARRLDLSMVRYSDFFAAPDAAERFATAVLAQIPAGGRHMALLNCGHPPPLLLHRRPGPLPRSERTLAPAEHGPADRRRLQRRDCRARPRRPAAVLHRRGHRDPRPLRHVLSAARLGRPPRRGLRPPTPDRTP